MQNVVPGGKPSSSGNAGYVSHTATTTTVPATHQIQPATSLGQQPGNNAYFSSVQVVDPAAAFPFNIDPVNQNLAGYPNAMAPPPAINNFDPSQLALPLDAYQPRVEFPEQFFVMNHQPMAPLPEAAAGLPALAHGTDGGHRQQPMIPRDAPLLCKWEGCTHARTFSRIEELLRHIKNLHIAPRSYPCEVCGRPFNQAYNRTAHMRSRHWVEWLSGMYRA
ncbi:hypothetical protein BO83DRAFT_417877 [Aspergillus eucalypticola CBS 122712]|uniref:C2H2-type domain-containing protein n=1 Tax=Aspergillus eucalypticola (strain CBS 122712 / IBT 29274) TaxID=1448314 RepID=A0A317VDD0_ASPEC|nr:uncharacterized protein BO83DRAFT_417877 [Aspergillus eucalypticola CBS 122712]PWY71271.1 hypothetical protein BO83DRAFT_417877 [Aspergillus eucalypticola CBS 122712]